MHAMRRLVAAVALLVLAGSSAAWAQHPQVREGFWIGFGFGYGSARVSCDGCANPDRKDGTTAFLKMGGTLNDRVLLGGEVNVWTKQEGLVMRGVGNASFAVYYYLRPAGGWFVRGGIGSATALESDGNNAEANGYGFVVGTGYDIRVGRNLSITPVVNFSLGADGDLKDGGTLIESGMKHNVLELGLGVTFH